MVKIVILTVISISSIWHPLHVSVCEIDYDLKRKALEITQRIFVDDLETELKKEHGDELDFLNTESQQRDLLLEKYINKHVQIQLEGQDQKLEYLGHEIENEALFCYFQITDVSTLRSIKVRNDILFKIHADQINLVHVSIEDNVKSMKLWAKESESEVLF